MVAVLLGIWKILGLVLLILLGLVLLVILLVLLVPVRYRAEGSFAGAVKGKAGVSWLLHLVSCQVSYEEALAFRIRIFGFPLRLGEKDEPEAGDSGAEPEAGEQSFEAEEPGERSAKTAGMEPDRADMLFKMQEAKPREESAGHTQAGQAQDQEPVSGKPEPDTPKKRFSIGGLCDKLKKKAAGIRRKLLDMRNHVDRVRKKLLDMRNHVDRIREKLLGLKEKKDLIFAFWRDEENKKAFSLIKRRGFALLRHVQPKKLAGRIRFGFDDPSTTGTVLMYAAPFYGLYARHLELIPDFEETGIEGEIRLSGRIRLGYLLFSGARLLLNRNFRQMLKKLKKLRQELG